MSNLQPKNALTHGLYSSDIVLQSERQEEFDALLQAFRNEYCPDGVSEEAAVFDLASLHWKKRRFDAGLQQALQKQRNSNTVTDTTSDDWDLECGSRRGQVANRSRAACLRANPEIHGASL